MLSYFIIQRNTITKLCLGKDGTRSDENNDGCQVTHTGSGNTHDTNPVELNTIPVIGNSDVPLDIDCQGYGSKSPSVNYYPLTHVDYYPRKGWSANLSWIQDKEIPMRDIAWSIDRTIRFLDSVQ